METSAAGPTRRPLRVLLADDHRVFAESLATTLTADDRIEVVGFAHDGNDAVRLAAELDPDIVLMDIVMPGLDGIEATRRIRSSRAGPCVMILTSSDSPADAEKARAAGAAAFVTKERSLGELMDVFFETTSLVLAFGGGRTKTDD
jgi:two-component system NarL family response regulator